jgi:hypothetical protein
MATVMVTALAVVGTTERGSAKPVRGKQATAKVKRRSSSVQQNNRPTTKQGTTKVAREKQVAHRAKSRSSGAQQNNQPTTEQGSAKAAREMQLTAKIECHFCSHHLAVIYCDVICHRIGFSALLLLTCCPLPCQALHPSSLFVSSNVRLPCIVHTCLVQLPHVVFSCFLLYCPLPHRLAKFPRLPSSCCVVCHPITLHCPPPTHLAFPPPSLVASSATSLPCIVYHPLLSHHHLPAQPSHPVP